MKKITILVLSTLMLINVPQWKTNFTVLAEDTQEPEATIETPESTSIPDSTMEPEITPPLETTVEPVESINPEIMGEATTLDILSSSVTMEGLNYVAIDGGLKVTVANFDMTTREWNNGVNKSITVEVDFGDDTSTGKKLEFMVPEGMRFTAIPVPNSYTTQANTDVAIATKLEISDPVGSAITSLTFPVKESGYNTATYGKVVYNFTPGTKKIALTFTVRVDEWKYYGEHVIKNSLNIKTFKDIGTSSLIGEVDVNMIKALGFIHIGTAPYNVSSCETIYRMNYVAGYLDKVLPSTPEVSSFNISKGFTLQYNGTISPTRYFYPKQMDVTMYYPIGTEFVGITDYLGNHRATKNLIFDNATGIVTYTLDNSTGYSGSYGVKVKIPEGTPTGTYTASASPTAVITTYDDTVFHVNAYTNRIANTTTLEPPFSFEVVRNLESKLSVSTMNSEDFFDSGKIGFYGTGYFTNNTGLLLKDVMYRVSFDPQVQVYRVRIPFDKSIAGNAVTEVRYKTNLNSTYRTYSGPLAPVLSDKFGVSFSKANAGLEPDEYFTEIEANIGKVYPGFVSHEALEPASYGYRAAQGSTPVGTTQVITNYTVWQKGLEAETTVNWNATSKVRTAAMTASATGQITFKNSSNITINNITAGNLVKTSAVLSLHRYPYGTITQIDNPVIYIRELASTTIDPNSFDLRDKNNNPVNFDLVTRRLMTGEKVYELKTKNISVGDTIGYELARSIITVNYEFMTDISIASTVNTNGNQLIAWGASNITSSLLSYAPHNDANDAGIDFDGDGISNEILPSVASSPFVINANKNVLIKTYLAVQGESPKTYVSGNNSTLSYFTPGTIADYKLVVKNNTNQEASNLVMYIPIPKTGNNFGVDYQQGAFNWNLKLNGSPLATGTPINFTTEVSNTTNAVAPTFVSYGSTIADKDVTLVKITIIDNIPAGAELEFSVPLVIDETIYTAVGRTGKNNIYNPRYSVKSSTYEGTLSGTRVGSQLVIAEIDGTFFEDKNMSGIYDVGDTLLQGANVSLYKLNTTTNLYEPVLDGTNTPISTNTNNLGQYKFDYNHTLGYGTYAVKFEHAYVTAGTHKFTRSAAIANNTPKDSNAINDLNYPQAGDSYVGWVVGIDATNPIATDISAGIIQYNPISDLSVAINPNTPITIKVNKAATLDAIVPSNFEGIKSATEPIKWELVNTTDSANITLTNNTTLTAALSGRAVKSNIQVRITVKDMYGNTKTALTTVNVISNDPPVINGSNITLNVGDSFNELDSITDLNVVDDHDGNPVLNPTFIVDKTALPMSSGKVTTPGKYNVIYSTRDSDNNTGTKTIVVTVNGNPVFSNVITTKDVFAMDPIDLTHVTASYIDGADGLAKSIIPTNLEGTSFTPTGAEIKEVIHTATNPTGSSVTVMETYRVYGLPQLTVTNNAISIPENATLEQVKNLIGITTSIATPEGTTETPAIAVNYTNYATCPSSLTVTATYTLGNGTSKQVTQSVAVTKVDIPVITANDIEKHVGETLDILADSSATTTGTSAVSLKSSSVDMAAPGTYEAVLSVNDYVNPEQTKTIKVLVHGPITFEDNEGNALGSLPSLTLPKGSTIGLATDAKAYYLKASTDVGDTPIKTEIQNGTHGTIILNEIKNSLNTEVLGALTTGGIYTATYTYTTPDGYR